jgi:hypothetical protein
MSLKYSILNLSTRSKARSDSRVGFLALVLCISLLSSACGPSGPTIITSPETNQDNQQVRLRWFPSPKARGYRLSIKSSNNTAVQNLATVPFGCTHEGVEGYTSGLCVLDVPLPTASDTYRLTLTAVNEHGESIGTVLRVTK